MCLVQPVGQTTIVYLAGHSAGGGGQWLRASPGGSAHDSERADPALRAGPKVDSRVASQDTLKFVKMLCQGCTAGICSGAAFELRQLCREKGASKVSSAMKHKP